MHCNAHEGQSEYDQADHVQEIIPVSPDHIGIVHDHGIEKTEFVPGLFRLELVECGHQQGIARMAFAAEPDRFLLGLHQVCHENAVADPRVAFDAPYVPEMQRLVGQPVMGLDDVDAFPVGQQFKFVEIGMAGKADRVVVGYGCLQVFRIADADMIRMRVAFPTGESSRIGQVVYALLELLLDLFKMVMGISLIPSVAVKAGKGFLKPRLKRVRKVFILVGMAVQAGETFMVRPVKILPEYQVVTAHMPGQDPSGLLAGEEELGFPVAAETFLVLIDVIIHEPEVIQQAVGDFFCGAGMDLSYGKYQDAGDQNTQ